MPKLSKGQSLVLLAFVFFGLLYFTYVFAIKERIQGDVPAGVRGVELPQVSFKNFEGAQTLAEDPQGRPFLLHFWASDCAPCLEELPILLKMQKSLADKLGLVTISTDATLQNAKNFLANGQVFDTKNEGGVLWLWDPRALQSATAFAVVQVPESFLITSNRRIVYKFTGAIDWSDQKNIELIKKYLF